MTPQYCTGVSETAAAPPPAKEIAQIAITRSNGDPKKKKNTTRIALCLHVLWRQSSSRGTKCCSCCTAWRATTTRTRASA